MNRSNLFTLLLILATSHSANTYGMARIARSSVAQTAQLFQALRNMYTTCAVHEDSKAQEAIKLESLKQLAETGECYGCDLAFADLKEAIAAAKKAGKEIVLVGANLKGANLAKTDLAGANFYKANLEGANLANANLPGASFAFANLEGANLANANLKRASLHNANLQKANLAGVNLQETNLLEGVDLSYANLQMARHPETKSISTKPVREGVPLTI